MSVNMYLKLRTRHRRCLDGARSSGRDRSPLLESRLRPAHQSYQELGRRRHRRTSNHQNFSFTKYLDAATNSILKNCWSGQQIGKATLTCFRTDGARGKYLTIQWSTSSSPTTASRAGPGRHPGRKVSLDYGVIQYTYLDQKNAGGASATHNLQNGAIS